MSNELTPYEQSIQLVLNTLMKHLPAELDVLYRNTLDPDYPFFPEEHGKYLEVVKTTGDVMAVFQKIIDEGGHIKYVDAAGNDSKEDLGYL